jgi:hypothetical protein
MPKIGNKRYLTIDLYCEFSGANGLRILANVFPAIRCNLSLRGAKQYNTQNHCRNARISTSVRARKFMPFVK